MAGQMPVVVVSLQPSDSRLKNLKNFKNYKNHKTPFMLDRLSPQLNRGETTTTGICPAISGATQYSPALSAPGWILMSLLNLAHSSQWGPSVASRAAFAFASATRLATTFVKEPIRPPSFSLSSESVPASSRGSTKNRPKTCVNCSIFS